MAIGMLSLRPAAVIVVASVNSADDRRSDARKASSSSNWWNPIFGFSAEPDYICMDLESKKEEAQSAAVVKFKPGSFTEEKAKQLRRMTAAAGSFHDGMYHSAVASKLASDFSHKS